MTASPEDHDAIDATLPPHLPMTRLVTLSLALLAAPPMLAAQQDSTKPVAIHGTVRDSLSRDPVRRAVVRAMPSGRSTLTDDDGRYQLTVPGSDTAVDARAIGFTPTLTAIRPDSAGALDLWMRRMPVELAPIVATAEDDPAARLVRAAIARKHQLFGSLHDYRYDAFVKFVVRDLSKPQDSASAIQLITETRTTAYWEQPDHYQETILARRQSVNIDADRNLVSVGEIVNFNRERIDLQRYTLVSPIADDALDAYHYTILDTLDVDGHRVIRLALAPKNNADPLFVGMIDVADSTADLVGVDLGVNDAVRFNFVKNLRYRQHIVDLGNGRWMPDDIRFTGEVRLGVPLPGLPSALAFEHVASLTNFRFNEGQPPAGLNEYRIIVDDQADHADTAVWSQTRAVPLSDAEREAWVRIDSMEGTAGFLERTRRVISTGLFLAGDGDIIHYNRVDGFYAGLGWTWRTVPGWVFDAKAGNGMASGLWQYRFGIDRRLSESQRIWVGASVHDETMARATLGGGRGGGSFDALLFGIDRLDYYRERGYTLSFSTKLVDFTRLDLAFHDEHQTSLPVSETYVVFPPHRTFHDSTGAVVTDTTSPILANPPIADGQMRSFTGSLSIDSRAFMRQKGVDLRLRSPTYTRLTLSGEISSPSLVPTDFDFGRYSATLERRQRLWNWGFTTLTLSGAVTTGVVPPQRYYGVDFSFGALSVRGGGVRSLSDSNFQATRAATATIRQDFGRLFMRTGIPLIRALPFTLSLLGGAYWTELSAPPVSPDSAAALPLRVTSARAGFQLGNLTPFLGPFDFGIQATWVFSSYLPTRFQLGFDLTP